MHLLKIFSTIALIASSVIAAPAAAPAPKMAELSEPSALEERQIPGFCAQLWEMANEKYHAYATSVAAGAAIGSANALYQTYQKSKNLAQELC